MNDPDWYSSPVCRILAWITGLVTIGEFVTLSDDMSPLSESARSIQIGLDPLSIF